MQQQLVALALASLVWALGACGDDDGTEMPEDGGGTDAGQVPELTYEAEPDPAELDSCTTEPPASGEARAKHIACEEELLGGTVAMGRVGPDIVVENAVARFVIRGSDGAASLPGMGAGGVVDAATHGRPDLVKDVLPFTGVSTVDTSEVVVTRAGGDAVTVRAIYEAQVVDLVAGILPSTRAQRIRGAIDYELRADEPVLRVTVRATTLSGVAVESFTGGFGVLVGGAGELLQPMGDGPEALLDGPRSGAVLRMPGTGNLAEIASINLLEGEERTARRGEEVTYELIFAVGDTAADAYAAAHAEDDGLATLTLTGTAHV